MGYRVDYQPMKKVRGADKMRSRVPAFTALCLLLFLLLVNSAWQRGAEVLRGMIFPGDAAVTAAALEDFTVELRAGEPLSGAFESFCRKIITETEFDQD